MIKLSMSNIAWSSVYDAEMYEFLCANGFQGLEIAPTRIFPDNPYDHIKEARFFAKKLKDSFDISISSIQSIWYGINENIFGSDEDRKRLYDYTVKAINFANAVGCENIVFGCPRNRNMVNMADKDIALNFFSKIGSYAVKHGVIISLEPNPVIYGTNFINSTEDAIDFVKEVCCPNFLVNLDLGTIIYNREDLSEMADSLPIINHIHISEPGLECILKRRLHQELADFLRANSYLGYVSIEMKNQSELEKAKESAMYVKGIFD